MGTFYRSIAIATPDMDAVDRALTMLGRHACLARDGHSTYVFDERCDNQDLDEIEWLTTALSKDLGCAALAACNHDDDVLVVLLAQAGTLIDRYDSNPGFDGPPGPPRGGNAERLCAAFAVPDKRRDIDALLRRPHEQVVFESERHAALCRLLGLSERMAMLGYRYVARGEMDNLPASSSAVRLVPRTGRGSDLPERERAAGPGGSDNELILAIQAEAQDLFWNSYALTLGQAQVPERFAPLLGIEHGNGHLLLTRLLQYFASHGLMHGGWVHADELVAEFLGTRRFAQVATARLLRVALGLQPLSDDQIAAFNRGDQELHRRIAQAVERAQRDAGGPGINPAFRISPDEP